MDGPSLYGPRALVLAARARQPHLTLLVGVTGHQDLRKRCAKLVRTEIERKLRALDGPLVGLTSLAAGSDQIFAEVLLGVGGQLVVVLPSDHIEASFKDPSALVRFGRLMRRASEISRLPFDEPGEEAYWAAGKKVVERSDLLFAVWDGQSSRGLGGTADVVAYARELDTPVTVVWPEGCGRS